MAAQPPPTRPDREHQRILRELRQQGQSAQTWGLPNPAAESSVLGMGLVIRDRLADAKSTRRAAEAAALAAGMLDKTIQRMPQAATFECARGCNFCCRGAVSVSAPEVFRIVHLLADGAKIGAAGLPALEKDAVLARAKARGGATLEAVLSLRDPCPLLIEGECGVYEDRPLGCRQFVSSNLAGCRTAFESGRGDLPYVPAAANAGLVLRSLLLSAAASLGMRADTYELSSALVVAASQPDGERRWLAGEDVLAGALKTPQPPKMQSSVQRWSQMLSGLFE